jgi:hypothetical protein
VCTLGEVRKRGEGMTKKEAKTEAARKMLQKLRSRGFDRQAAPIRSIGIHQPSQVYRTQYRSVPRRKTSSIALMLLVKQ